MTEAETLREQNLRLQAHIEELEAHSRTEDPLPPTRSPSQNSPGPHPHLSAEEKQRREDLRLCRVCGSDKHFKNDCPVHKAKENKGPS